MPGLSAAGGDHARLVTESQPASAHMQAYVRYDAHAHVSVKANGRIDDKKVGP
jgi:hypothetical protein